MKPDFKNIIKTDSLRATADIACEAIGNKQLYFKEVLMLSLEEKSPENWRAARVIGLSILKYPNLFVPYVNKIANLFPEFKNDGLKRSYAFVLSKYVKYLSEDNLTKLIETCFSYMLSNEKVAVKFNCLTLLFNISEKFSDLKPELLASIEFNLSKGVFRLNGDIKKYYRKLQKYC